MESMVSINLYPYGSDTLTVSDIFTKAINNKPPTYNIPVYQRYYTWGKQQITDLLIDIQEALDNQELGFFLGPVLFREEKEYYDIIDGQQRIITVSVAISYLMHELAEDDIDHNKTIAGKSINGLIESAKSCLWNANTDLIDISNVEVKEFEARLKFLARDNDTGYEFIICKNEVVGGSSPLARSLKFIKNYFNSKSREELSLFLDYLLNNTFMVVIRTTQTHSINKIFETLNDRGMPLNQVELFKNFVSGYIQVANPEDDFFQKIYIALNKNINVLERYFWTYSLLLYGYGDDKSNKPGLWYRFWKKQIVQNRNKKQIEEELISLSNKMCESLGYYKAILSIDDPYWENESINEFPGLAEKAGFLIKYKITHQILFTLIREKELGQLTSEKFSQCINFLYAFIARIWVVYGMSRPQQVEYMLVEVACDIANKKMEPNPKNILCCLQENHSNKYTHVILDNFFIKEFKSMTYSNLDPRIKFIYNHISHAIESLHEQTSFQSAKIHYVLPQDIACLEHWENFTSGSHSECKDMLGNIVMLEPQLDNEVSSNPDLSFEGKKEFFQQSGFKLTCNISDKRVRWKPEKIKSIQSDYAKRMAAVLCLEPKVQQSSHNLLPYTG